MKKRVIFFSCLAFIFLVLTIVNLNFVFAEEPALNYDALGQAAEKIPTSPEGAVDVGNAYLRQEWTKIMDKYPIGRFFLTISNFLSALNFYWNPVFGMNYSFSLAFVFSIIIWLVLFFIIYELTEAFFDKKWMSIVAGFAIVSLIGLTGVIIKFVNLLSLAINNKWIVWLSLIIAVIIMAIIIKLGGGLKAYLEKQKEEAKKEQLARDRKIISTQAKVAEEELKEFSDKKK